MTHTADTTGPPDTAQDGVGGWGGWSGLRSSYDHQHPLAEILWPAAPLDLAVCCYYSYWAPKGCC